MVQMSEPGTFCRPSTTPSAAMQTFVTLVERFYEGVAS